MGKVFLFFLIFIFFPFFGKTSCLNDDIVPGKYIVRLKKVSPSTLSLNSSPSNLFSEYLKERKITFSKIFSDSDISLTSVRSPSHGPPPTYFVENLSDADREELASRFEVDTIDNDCFYKIKGTSVAPNDPYFPRQWSLKSIQALEAWSISMGKTSVIVAVSDTGVDYSHEDLAKNMWINKGELASNNTDDDKNGCVDDIYGCDFANHTGDPFENGSGLGHGTHVAGIIAATLNNSLGISGIAPQAKIMALKGFDSEGKGDSSALLQTIYYAVQNGAKIINCSWGRPGTYNPSDLDAFEYAYNHGVTVIVAAGNEGIDAANFVPANLPHVITVGSIDSHDRISSFSNWGTSLKFLAPGGQGYDSRGAPIDGIYSTLPNNSYGQMIGTSMAAPYVTGLAALILSIHPQLNSEDILKILTNSGDPIQTVSPTGKNINYKKINALNAVKLTISSLPPSQGSTKSSDDGSSQDLTKAFTQNAGCGSISKIKKPSPTGEGFSNNSILFALLIFPAFIALAIRPFQTNQRR